MRHRRHRERRLAAGALAALALAPASGAAAQPPALAWQPVTAPVRGGELSALAFDAASATLAIGDVRGALVGPVAGPFERRLRRGPVRDLAFLTGEASGSLLAATARGLFLLEAGGRVSEVSPGPGPAARAATRLAVTANWIAVATDDGVFFSRDARRWLRAVDGFPAGAASALALRERAGALECWAVVAGEPWSAQLALAGEQLLATGTRRQTVSFGAAVGGPVDLALDLAGADVVMLYAGAFALRDAPADAWRVVRLELPPGAEALRLGAGAGRFFLATLRGLLVADALAGPWRRSEPPAGSAAVRALAGDASVLFAAADSGVLAGSERAPAAAVAPSAAATAPGAPPLARPDEPGIEQVHRAALAYLRLQPRHVEELRRGVTQRGWLPVVAVRGGYAHDESRAALRDEVVSSGALWQLRDLDHDRGHGYDVSVSVAWELGDLLYHPESIDVSHEAREVIELRDDVLDEITQLFFERLRVIAQLAALEDPHDAEALRLGLRADELAAGIDAWTGGWFGRRTRAFAADSDLSPRVGGN